MMRDYQKLQILKKRIEGLPRDVGLDTINGINDEINDFIDIDPIEYQIEAFENRDTETILNQSIESLKIQLLGKSIGYPFFNDLLDETYKEYEVSLNQFFLIEKKFANINMEIGISAEVLHELIQRGYKILNDNEFNNEYYLRYFVYLANLSIQYAREYQNDFAAYYSGVLLASIRNLFTYQIVDSFFEDFWTIFNSVCYNYIILMIRKDNKISEIIEFIDDIFNQTRFNLDPRVAGTYIILHNLSNTFPKIRTDQLISDKRLNYGSGSDLHRSIVLELLNGTNKKSFYKELFKKYKNDIRQSDYLMYYLISQFLNDNIDKKELIALILELCKIQGSNKLDNIFVEIANNFTDDLILKILSYAY